jgi:polysaccharide export outer membrane protein
MVVECLLWTNVLLLQAQAAKKNLKESVPPAKVQVAPEMDPRTKAYKIGPGDVLQVIVWRETDISQPMITVRPDGKISLPLVKEIDVAGFTTDEVEKDLANRLKPFVKDPDVSVIVRESHSQKVYVIGAVRREGPIRLSSPLTILQALAEAGGVTEYAKRKKIYVLRNVIDRQVRLPFDYEAVLRGEKGDQNVLLLPGDTVVVPH